MATEATYQAVIDRIDAAMGSATGTLQSLSLPDGRNVTFRSAADLLAIRREYQTLLDDCRKHADGSGLTFWDVGL